MAKLNPKPSHGVNCPHLHCHISSQWCRVSASLGVGFAIGIGKFGRLLARFKVTGKGSWRSMVAERRQGIFEKNRGMGCRNEAVAVPSLDASHTDFPRPFVLQAAHMLGVSHSEGNAASSS